MPRKSSAFCAVSSIGALALLAGCHADRAAPATSSFPAPARVCIREGKEAPVPATPMGDAATIGRILDEGKNRNRVMDHLWHLTQHIGPRLTASSNAQQACEWTLAQFRSWGLDAKLYQWGEY